MKLKELFENGDIRIASHNFKDGKFIKHYNDEFKGNFYCNSYRLTSIEGAPSIVIGNFGCHDNDLTNLEGAPISVIGDFYCNNNKLESLKGIGKEYLKRIDKAFYAFRNPIKSNVLGILLIKNCKEIDIDNKKVQKIINKYLTEDRDILECREELVQAGFKEYAKL